MENIDIDGLLIDVDQTLKYRLAESTNEQYVNIINSYEFFCSRLSGNPSPYPITERLLKAFIVFRKMNHCKYGTLKNTKFAIGFKCRVIGQEDVTKSDSIKEYFRALNNQLHGDNLPNVSTPLVGEDLRKICSLDPKFPQLLKYRDLAMITVQFYGMLRVSELTNLTFNDFEIAPGLIRFTIRKSKTDQSGKGHDFYIQDGKKEYNAYKHFICYIQNLPQELHQVHLFKSTNKWGNIFILDGIKPDAYNRRIKKWCKAAGLEERNYSSHSIRRGAARTAALNGASISSIKERGNWKSSVFLRYIEVDSETAEKDLFNKL